MLLLLNLAAVAGYEVQNPSKWEEFTFAQDSSLKLKKSKTVYLGSISCGAIG